MRRRDLFKRGLAAAAGAHPLAAMAASSEGKTPFRHSVCRWCFGAMPLGSLARMARDIGIASVELLDPDEWPVVQAAGLTCAMASAPAPPVALAGRAGPIEWGWNRSEHHDWLVPAYTRLIEQAAAAGIPNVVCFSGNRAGLSDVQGLATCTAGLRRITPAAERLGVTVCMELLNSRVDHPDYQADHTAWGIALVDAVGSDRFRLLYDIYHMQIMEGDVIRTVTAHARAIGHYHTAGVPGRHETDDTQELFYPAIARAIAATGFSGYVAQEFIPTGDPRTVLAEAVARCTV